MKRMKKKYIEKTKNIYRISVNNVLVRIIKKIMQEIEYKLNPSLLSDSTENIFKGIYERNKWGSDLSVSGFGSEYSQTELIIFAIPKIINEYKITSILDIPCGDFNWMRKVDMSQIKYIGADIVSEITDINNQKYSTKNKKFLNLNLLQDKLPKSDLIICRDCLVHFSEEDIFKALKNICESDSGYLMTTNFLKHKHNRKIATGKWRRINLTKNPFNLPDPIESIYEGCTEAFGFFDDKHLSIWSIKSIKNSLY